MDDQPNSLLLRRAASAEAANANPSGNQVPSDRKDEEAPPRSTGAHLALQRLNAGGHLPNRRGVTKPNSSTPPPPLVVGSSASGPADVPSSSPPPNPRGMTLPSRDHSPDDYVRSLVYVSRRLLRESAASLTPHEWPIFLVLFFSNFLHHVFLARRAYASPTSVAGMVVQQDQD